MEIRPIAYFRSPLMSKFGIPRQSGIVKELVGEIVFTAEYGSAEAVRGLETFDYIWLIWGFSENNERPGRSTVRPPRLGGNSRVGVFATRSSYRPNGLALSSVKIEEIDTRQTEGVVIRVSGADLMDGTPIYDVKPYVEFVDSHPGVRSGFVDTDQWQRLDVVFDDALADKLTADGSQQSIEGRINITPEEHKAIVALLAEDPRPQYHHDPNRIYGMPFNNYDIRFRVDGKTLTIIDIVTP